MTPKVTLSGDISSNSDVVILTRGESVADVDDGGGEPAEPAISVVPNTLSTSCGPGNDAAGQTFEVWNSGGEAISYHIAWDAGFSRGDKVDGVAFNKFIRTGVNPYDEDDHGEIISLV